MPTPEQILDGLYKVANAWKLVSIFWHVYFGVIVVALAIDVRPAKRAAGFLLGLPFLSVAAGGWMLGNPVNAGVFAIVGIVLLLFANRLPEDGVQIGPRWSTVPGVLLFAFGWIYPRFLDTSSYLTYLYAAPVGTVPCPTLIIVIGLALIIDDLGTRRIGAVLGLIGLLYGAISVQYLGVALDVALILGAAMILMHAFGRRWSESARGLLEWRT